MNQLKITRKFVLGSAFEKAWKSLGFKDEDLRRLQKELLQNPKVGDVIRGTGRLRKMRFAFEHRGKSGSTRICYVDFEVKEVIYLPHRSRKPLASDMGMKAASSRPSCII